MIFRWLFINILTVIFIVFWSWAQGYDSHYVLMGKVIAQGAFILFIVNLNMYFVFLIIRKSKVRKVKIKLAKISKGMMKYHIPIAITASLLIVLHAWIMIYASKGQEWNITFYSGAITIFILMILLISGWFRRKKATGRRRKFHYLMAFIFTGFMIAHIFL